MGIIARVFGLALLLLAGNVLALAQTPAEDSSRVGQAAVRWVLYDGIQQTKNGAIDWNLDRDRIDAFLVELRLQKLTAVAPSAELRRSVGSFHGQIKEALAPIANRGVPELTLFISSHGLKGEVEQQCRRHPKLLSLRSVVETIVDAIAASLPGPKAPVKLNLISLLSGSEHSVRIEKA